MYPKGSLFISRNNNQAMNHGYSLWNHLSFYLGSGQLGESQEGQGTIATVLDDYLARDYTYGILIPRSKYLEAGELAATIARQMLGRRYGKLSSIRPRQHRARRMNCVTYAWLPWQMALRKLFPGERFGRVVVPDDVLETGVFRL